jgi:hypothetical protein
VQSGVGELHLSLGTGRPCDAAASRIRFEVIEQCRLADAGLSSQDEDLTVPGSCPRDQTVEDRALPRPAEQRGLPIIRLVTHDASGVRAGESGARRRDIEGYLGDGLARPSV